MTEGTAPAQAAPTTGAAAALADADATGVFFDAATWQDIPRGSDAALYGDGRYTAPSDAPAILELNRHRLITVTGAWQRCSIIDYERLNPAYHPVTLRAFVRGRKKRKLDAIVYCNESTAAEAVRALADSRDELGKYPGLLWWIATLDGVSRSAAELCTTLATEWDAPEITTANLWANQWTGTATVDRSNRFLLWRPPWQH